jgi:exopolysaccharide biosynthesis polyprenyl glycosylphosphotransferase
MPVRAGCTTPVAPMTTTKRLAWMESSSTLALLVSGAALGLGPTVDVDVLWGLVPGVILMAGVCLLALYFNDLYDFERPQDLPHLFGRLCRALGWSALILAVAYLVFPPARIPGHLASITLVMVLGAVLAIRATTFALTKRPPFTERVLILGTGPLARELGRQIETRPDLPLRLVGFAGEPAAGRTLCGYREVEAAVHRHRVHRIIVAMPERRRRLPVEALLACRVRGIRIDDGTEVFERLTRRLAVEALTPGALVFGDGFRVSRARLALKRGLSVVVAVTALTVGLPLMALIALAIKLDSRGPVFFVQERVGLRGRRFPLLKFRTMRVAEPSLETMIRDNVSRVTRVGAVLRRYRLDEIPQFINILRGDMSLVGPRPEMVQNVATFATRIPFYTLRHEVRPGLTGWAQVRAGYSMSLEEVTGKLCYDLYYVKHLSLAFDLRILVDTVKFVLSGKRPG